jgi:hypothetical protein
VLIQNQGIAFCWNVSDFLQPRNDLSILPDILDGARESKDVRVILSSHSQDGHIPALWLRLLLNLSTVTTDERTEVRNSATQTIQRIFESYSEQLSSTVWMLCLRTVLFDLVQANIAVQKDLRTVSPDDRALTGWNDTTTTVLQTVGVLYTAYMERLESAQLGDAWAELLEHLQQYFNCNTHALGLPVFKTITGILSHVDDTEALGMPAILKTADTWNAYFDHSKVSSGGKDGNQDAFVAYAEAFEPIYRLSGRSLDPQLPSMLANLEACIVDSDEVAYSSDENHMTPLQTRVIECISRVKTEGSEQLPSCLISLLSRLITLPYVTLEKDPTKRGPTFVALAKAAMTLLQDIIIRHADQKEMYSDGSFLLALQSLEKPVHEKYTWQREGKPPTLWQKATTTAISILMPAFPTLNARESDSSYRQTWETIIRLSNDITRAQLPPSHIIPTSMEQDEAFDMDSFGQLRDLITPSLGSTSITDALRRTYTRNLFSLSLIYTPLPGELPDLTSAPLEDLYKTRYGQTAELETTLRIDMSYTCLSELFNLVRAQHGTASRIKLAQAASPYLILRAALPLKTYIADQPIRGRMPMPEAQRRELLFVLGELAKLDSEPQAIPDAPGVKSKHRKHLHRLYPLLNKASRAARKDAEVFEHLARLMDMVGEEFGLDDE